MCSSDLARHPHRLAVARQDGVGAMDAEHGLRIGRKDALPGLLERAVDQLIACRISQIDHALDVLIIWIHNGAKVDRDP